MSTHTGIYLSDCVSTLWSVCTFTFECCATQLHPFPAFKKLLFMFAVSLARKEARHLLLIALLVVHASTALYVYVQTYVQVCYCKLVFVCLCVADFSAIAFVCAPKRICFMGLVFQKYLLGFCRRTKRAFFRFRSVFPRRLFLFHYSLHIFTFVDCLSLLLHMLFLKSFPNCVQLYINV